MKNDRIDVLAYVFATLELILNNPGISNKLHLSLLIPELVKKLGSDNFKLREVVLIFLRKLSNLMKRKYTLNTFIPYLD